MIRITDAESRVMQALWRGAPLSADQLITEVRAETDWGEATVKTLIHRLLKKKALRSERVDGRHQYQAVVQRSEYVDAESQGFLDKMFGGQLSPLVAHFAGKGRLSEEDRARLKALVEKLDD